ncbi:hypothetical protein F5144DRAFT_480639, partial [Chaetomium tenue]
RAVSFPQLKYRDTNAVTCTAQESEFQTLVWKRVFISSTPVFSGISAGVTCSVTVLNKLPPGSLGRPGGF